MNNKEISINNEDLKIIENFITKEGPRLDFEELQAIVKMQYDLYKKILERRLWIR